ncbi:MAG: DUF1570 domain-containing protein [Verrucomicrobia bacterium]|nr:DUF1570 domain-containing protein [Verrucomicrobiota bacterium]
MALLCVVRPVEGAPRETLRFSDTRTLPALGLQLRVMAGARERPLPIPQAFPYVITTDYAKFKTELFDPRELWVASQHAAEWEDADGNRLILASINGLWPGPFSRPHVLRDDYDAALGKSTPRDGWTPTALATWMNAFAGVNGSTAHRRQPPSPRFNGLAEFRFPATESNLLAYAFQLNPRALGQSQAPTNWLCALFRLSPDTDSTRVQMAVQSRFLHYLTAAPGSPESALAPSARFQIRAQAPGTNLTDVFLASKDQVAASIANLRDWWYAATEHYILISNLSVSERTAIRQLQTDVETLHSVYAKLIPPRVPLRAVSVIRMPATETQYTDYVGPHFSWTGGMWLPSRKELIIRPLDGQGGQARRQNLLHSAYHEAFHQYLYYAYDQIESSPWYNEGHAAMFENVKIQNRGVQVVENPAMAAYLERLFQQRDVKIPEVLQLNLDAFYAQDPPARLANYAVAWALVYYLRTDAARDRRSPYRDLLTRYEDLLWETRDAREATTLAFAELDLGEMAKDFRAFWLSPTRRAHAARVWLTREP